MINYEDKYNSIIGVRPNFDDTFNIVQEKPEAWKSFITNSQFESNLKKIFHAMMSTKSNLNDRKSIWIQGTYGTGKSHSTAVVKHLLADDTDEISDFVKSLADISLRQMINEFRSEHRAFPVVLRGAYTISNTTDMSYEIQKQTRDALKKAGIDISIKTDFEKALELLDEPYMESFWNKLLEEDLKIYYKDKEGIREALNENDKDILNIISNKYRKIMDGGFGTSSITKWLKDVESELCKTGVADHLLIIWDEFTSLLSLQDSRSILNTAQDIAELAKENDENGNLENIYLIVVTHKNIEQTDAYRLKDAEEQRLALARFIPCSYEMQPNTTYHILSSTLNRINESVLKELIHERVVSDIAVSTVVDKIAENTQGNIEEIKEKILSLYPFHPYTAYLSTFVSRQLGDAERSVFNFLNDEEVGFKKFIKSKINDNKFMPASYIWDFFLKINNSSIANGKLGEVINKYNMHYDVVKKQGNIYLDVFKTVLLLNALNAVVNSGDDSSERSLVTPNITNIRDCYSGIMAEKDIIDILDYFDKNNIIMKSADGIYEVSTTSISPEKLKEMLGNKYEFYNDITKARDAFPLQFSSLETVIKNNSGKTVRETEIIYLTSLLKNSQIEVQLRSRFSNLYSVHVCVFLSHGVCENTKNYVQERNKDELETYIRTLSSQEEFQNIVFMNIETPFTELWFSRFIDAISKMEIHQTTKPEESIAEKKKAQGWVQKWINSILNDGEVFVAFKGTTELCNFRACCNKISEDYIKYIFPCGLDTLKSAKKAPIWDQKSAKSIVENILYWPKRDEIESKLKGGIQTNIPALFKDDKNNYVFDNDMNILEGCDENQPVVKIVRKVRELLSPSNEPVIDLSEKLKLFFEPPYGLYSNPISMATISIALKPYIDKLFVAHNGTKVDKVVMRDIVEYLFKFANGSKKNSYLDVRFSSAEEIDLIEELNELFGLKESGLMNLRWRARDEFAKKVKAPIWMLKHVSDYKKEICSTIDDLFTFTIAPDEAISQSSIASLLRKVTDYRLELKTAITNASNMKLMEKYIKLQLNGNETDFSDESIAYYSQFVQMHMQKEVQWWTESELNLQINQANIEKKRKLLQPFEQKQDVKPETSGINSPVGGDLKEKKIEKQNTKDKIRNCNDSNVLKDILIKLIDENDYLSDKILEYFNKQYTF